MKKLNKLFAILVAMAMVMALAVTSAFAVDKKTGKLSEADQADYASAEAKLTKILTLADGQTKPENVTFTFNFSPDTNYTSTTTTTADAAAALVNKGTLTINTNQMTKTAYESDGNTVAYSVNIADAFGTFPTAGVYNFKVEEAQDAATGDNFKWTYSQQKYDVDVYVVDNGTTRTINNIVVTKDGETGKEKTTIVPTEETTKDLGDPTLYGCTFENIYSKNTVSPEPLTPENAVLNISKTVTGEYGDKTNQEFPFVLNITAPEGAAVSEVTAVVYTGNTAATPAKTYTIKLDGTDNEFTLKHGQELLFSTLPAGTTYTVKEDLDKSTTANEVVTYAVKNYDKYTANWDGSTNETPGIDQTSVSKTIKDDATSQRTAACVNAYSDESTTPEGILISNLPYIALALVAIGGLVAYVVIRRRNADEA